MFLCPRYKHISGIQSICDRRNTVWDFTKVFNRGRRRIRTFWLGKISRSLNIHNPWSSVQLAKNFVHRVGISPREINIYPMYIPIISNTYIHQLRWCLVPWEGARRGGQYTLLIDLMPNCSFGDGVGFTGWKCQNLVPYLNCSTPKCGWIYMFNSYSWLRDYTKSSQIFPTMDHWLPV